MLPPLWRTGWVVPRYGTHKCTGTFRGGKRRQIASPTATIPAKLPAETLLHKLGRSPDFAIVARTLAPVALAPSCSRLLRTVTMAELLAMSRQQLQVLAKTHGIRANQKSAALLEQLAAILQATPPAATSDVVEAPGDAVIQQQIATVVQVAPATVETPEVVEKPEAATADVVIVDAAVDAPAALQVARPGFTVEVIAQASRRELQAVCKGNNIRANQSTDALRSALMELLCGEPAPIPTPEAEQAVAPVAIVAKIAVIDDAKQSQIAEAPATVIAPDAAVEQIKPQVAPIAAIAPAVVEVAAPAAAPAAITAVPAAITAPVAAPAAAAATAAKVAVVAPVTRTAPAEKKPITPAMARIVLTSMMERHAPDKVGNIDNLLSRFVGRESELLQQVATKYGIGFNCAKNGAQSTTAPRAAGVAAGSSTDDTTNKKAVATTTRAPATIQQQAPAPSKRKFGQGVTTSTNTNAAIPDRAAVAVAPRQQPGGTAKRGRNDNTSVPTAASQPQQQVVQPRTMPTICGGGAVVRLLCSNHDSFCC